MEVHQGAGSTDGRRSSTILLTSLPTLTVCVVSTNEDVAAFSSAITSGGTSVGGDAAQVCDPLECARHRCARMGVVDEMPFPHSRSDCERPRSRESTCRSRARRSSGGRSGESWRRAFRRRRSGKPVHKNMRRSSDGSAGGSYSEMYGASSLSRKSSPEPGSKSTAARSLARLQTPEGNAARSGIGL